MSSVDHYQHLYGQVLVESYICHKICSTDLIDLFQIPQPIRCNNCKLCTTTSKYHIDMFVKSLPFGLNPTRWITVHNYYQFSSTTWVWNLWILDWKSSILVDNKPFSGRELVVRNHHSHNVSNLISFSQTNLSLIWNWVCFTRGLVHNLVIWEGPKFSFLRYNQMDALWF